MLDRNPLFRIRSFRPENLGQNALQMIGNLCFTIFLVGVLIFTITAATYEPEDPLFYPSTGEDFIASNQTDEFYVMMKTAIEYLKDIHFYRFGKPVCGYNDSSCHMAWRFRPKEGKTAAFYKDYPSFLISQSKNCTPSVVRICTLSVARNGDYHSGGNARKKNEKLEFEKKPEKQELQPVSLPAFGETINDSACG
ncbi:hypothetical protein ACSBR2_027852 [Camellia fascicularis]